MSISLTNHVVISSGNANPSPFSMSGGSTVSASTGNLIVMLFTYFDTSITAVTDSVGNTYTRAGSEAALGSASRASIWYCNNVIGGASIYPIVTYTGSSGQYFGCCGYVYTGQATSPLGAVQSQVVSSTGNTYSCPSITTTANNSIVIAVCYAQSYGIVSGNSPLQDVLIDFAGDNGFGDTALVATPTTLNLSFQASNTFGSTSNPAVVAEFKSPSGTTFTVTPSDTVNSSDSLISDPTKAITETQASSDSALKTIVKTISDTQSIQLIQETVQVLRHLGPLDQLLINEWVSVSCQYANPWTLNNQ